MAKYFTADEFRCKCGCGEVKVNDRLLDLLDKVREMYGKPMMVTSGYRCPTYNAQVGGVDGSAHTKGTAADISCSFGNDRFRMVKAALAVGCLRIGIGKDFIHMDVDRDLPQAVIWLYS
jgi:zinc D-Ala-D-Ala carboxypeptidase